MKDKAAVSLGKRGGQKTASLYGSEHFSNANKARKSHKGWPKGKKRLTEKKGEEGNRTSGVPSIEERETK